MARSDKTSRDIFIMVTNNCNLKCTYCYEGVKDKRKMEVSNIQPILQKEIDSQKSKFKEFFVVFHGGEPFMAYKELKQVSEWLWNKYPELSIKCLTTTNGTVINSEMKNWMIVNKNRFVPILSIDGTAESHDKNRPGSYHRIDKEFFLKHWPWQEVKMTISPETLPTLVDNFIHLRQLGFKVNPSLAKEVQWNLKKDLKTYAIEMHKLGNYFLENPDEKPCQLIDISLSDLSPLKNLPFNRACGAGSDIITYDVSGNAYPCHAFIGDPTLPYNKASIDQTFSLLNTNNGGKISPNCKNCQLYTICSPCYGLNYASRKDMGKFDPQICEFNKITVIASANMYARMFSDPKKYVALSDKSKEDFYLMASGIKHVLNTIKLPDFEQASIV
ncbi:4Fe-4S cluster-binding domain-containing protein [Prolixibacteraceae bacterium JC049]|nr:4Fe-4S cluster-binding domain-containing protein [Prolixibacteraceae bacterium JC049]